MSDMSHLYSPPIYSKIIHLKFTGLTLKDENHKILSLIAFFRNLIKMLNSAGIKSF